MNLQFWGGLIICCSILLAQTAWGAQLTSGVIAGGGGTSRGSSITLSGTLGQHDAGQLTSETSSLDGGFWGGIKPPETNKTIIITGTVTGDGGGPLPNVFVVLAGTVAGSTRTDEKGEFEFASLPEGGNYTVIPFLRDHKFNPPQESLEPAQQDAHLEFAGKTEIITPPQVQQAQTSSGIELSLNDLVYSAGEGVSARLNLGGYTVGVNQLHVVVSAPDSSDLEILRLNRAGTSEFVSATGLSIGAFTTPGEVRVMDGELTLKPGEMFVAIWYVSDISDILPPAEAMVWDFGVMTNPNHPGGAAEVAPNLAMTDDEKQVPPGGKRIGTLLTEGGLPIQIPVDELVIFPQDQKQLDRFLQESGGQILSGNVLPNENQPADAFLVRVKTDNAPIGDLQQLRVLMGEQEKLYSSSEDALRLYAMGLRFQLEGFNVAVNPRLQLAGVPTISTTEAANINNNMRLAGPMNIPKLWAFLALWDRDTQRIPMAILDMGFAPNRDFRIRPGGMIECDMEGGGLISSFICAPGAATGPPTVGNSFFGEGSWHGNGVVTTAGGIINNGWGSAGTGGQVAEPMLYRFGLASYAFEIGLGIRKAVIDGAAVINISAGYPCRALTTLGIEPNICSTEGRAALCTAATAVLAGAAAAACGAAPLIDFFAPGAGTAACIAATTAAVAASTACFSTIIAGNLRGPMESAVNFATAAGVPIVTIAGNRLSAESLPEVLRDIIDLSDSRTESWQIIPAMIPQTIVVAATGDDWPFSNQHFFGERVDIWAPIRSSYMAPSNTTVAAMSRPHVLRSGGDGIGGTSAASPYIAGVVAALQAMDPSLNPRTPGLSAAARSTITARIKTILTNTAWTPGELADMAPADRRDETINAVTERRNLVNPFRAILSAVPTGSMAERALALGYPDDLDFSETHSAAAADNPGFSRRLSDAEITGSIVAILGEDGAPTLADTDWFTYTLPGFPSGIFRQPVRLRIPRGFGNLVPRQTDYSISEVRGTAEEAEFIIRGPRLLAGAESAFSLAGLVGSDNVYKLTLLPPERVGDAPSADRFDLNNSNNPFESRPANNSAGRAVHLGDSTSFPELNWHLVEEGAAGQVHEILIRRLNFHTAVDTDWFEVRDYPNVPVDPESPGCQPELEIHFAPGMMLTAQDSDGTIIVARRPSVVRLPWRTISHPLWFKLEPATPGAVISYDLQLRLLSANARICELAARGRDMDAMMTGRGFFGFPGFLPDFSDFDISQFPGFGLRESDSFGRITTPDSYLLSWSGNGAFMASVELVEGQSIMLQMRDIQGNLVASAATPDLMGGLGQGQGPDLFKAASILPVSSPQSVLLLYNENLPPGDYILDISHGTLGTMLFVNLPAGAITDGSLPLEELLAGPQPEPPNIQIVTSGGGLKFTWDLPVKPFVLEAKSDLTDQQWLPANEQLNILDDKVEVVLQPGEERKFFRLRLAE